MNEDDLERVLQRYEPAGPPPSLRARVLGAPPGAKRAWPWAAAAAALLAAGVWLSSASSELMQTSAGSAPGQDSAAHRRARDIESLAESIAGADDPRALAEWMIDRRDADRETERILGAVGTTGAAR